MVLHSFLILVFLAGTSAITVQTNHGEIVGEIHSLDVNGAQYEVSRFLGIPYARPPVGELRFQKPQPMPPFTEPFLADKHGNICPQRAQPGVNMSEDCLVLNVFVPGRAAAVTSGSDGNPTGHAVMVFIHGGGYVEGTGDKYAGNTLAAFGDVIVVTMNYRLGFLGFFTTNEAHAPGNVALWDQHMALQWVHENIAAFGGDQNRITLFGHSAGAACVLLQSISPRNQGIIHRFITESGNGIDDVASDSEPEITTSVIEFLFNCNGSSSLANCLREIPYENLLTGINGYTAQRRQPALNFQPIVDGEFLRRKPYQLLTTNTEELEMLRSLDAIIGVLSHEGGFTINWLTFTGIDNFRPTSEQMRTQFVPSSLGRDYSEEMVETVIAEYTNWTNPEDPNNIRLEVVRLNGDRSFTAPSTVLANIHCGGFFEKTNRTSTYFYKFNELTSNHFQPMPNWVPGASHGDEVAFVFGFDPDAIVRMFDGNVIQPQAWEIDLSLEIMRYWSNFAKTGNPNSGAGQVTWPHYDFSNRKSIVLSRDTHESSFLYAREANFWYNLIPVLRAATVQETSGATMIHVDIWAIPILMLCGNILMFL